MCSGSESGIQDVADGEHSSPEPSAPDNEDLSESHSSKASLPEKLRNMDGRTSGMGLTAEELQELHKTDPKKVKRILANRSSAARSKVRKLRYIAELDSKSAALQQQVTGMTAEMRALQDGASRLGVENEWLFSQIVELQDQSLRLDRENDTLQAHIRQSQNINRVVPRSTTPANPFVCESQARLPPPVPLESLPNTRHLQIPTSAFQTVLQEPGYPPHMVTPGTALTVNLSSDPYPNMSNLNATLNPHLADHNLVFGPDRSLPGAAALQSHHSSEGSGMSSTTQELRLGPEDPALLEMLRSFDLGRPRSGHAAAVPINPNSLARYDRSLSLGMPPRREFMLNETQLQQRLGDLGLTYQPRASNMLAEGSLWPQRTSLASYPPPGPSLSQALSPSGLDAAAQLPQGLGRWRRHLSDPQSFNRGPYT